jgi:hypothetical protein
LVGPSITAIKPHVAARFTAFLLALFAAAGLVWADSELPLAVALAAFLLALAAGLLFRWRLARAVASVVLSLTAALSVLGLAYNAFLLAVIRPLGWHDFAATGISAIFCAGFIAGALWLQSAQAREYFAQAGQT